MRRLFVCLLCLLWLSGCSMVQNEILSVSPHVEQPTQPSSSSEQSTTIVSNRDELRGAVLSLITNWVEQGEILVQEYKGDVQKDLDDAVLYATQEHPDGSYAVDYMQAEFSGDNAQGRISVSSVFRRSAAEITSIVTVADNSAATELIRTALKDYSIALTLRIRNYSETDFVQLIRRLCLENPTEYLALPTLTANVYPKEGAMRILELHFSYPESREQMREKLQTVQTTLSSASAYVAAGKTDLDRVQRLSRFLTERVKYVAEETEPTMPAYSLLHEKTAHSLSFASVFYAECTSAGLRCRIVEGMRNDIPHYWNMVSIDGAYYHVDLQRSIELSLSELQLLYDEDLLSEGYTWDSTALPFVPRPIPPGPSASEG